jgi:eukaryotic-like serine/threonine-protein kinase
MDDAELSAQRVGKVLRDKWTLEKLVGVGGMAAVYIARHKIGRLDAIKILHPEYARSEQVRARFEQEAHVLNQFKHPGAVEVRDLETTEDGAPFIVMELLEGKSLADAIRERPPTPDDALRVADEVLDVLAAAHAQGIIHRDIKPDNLFVLPSGAIKVLDFGIAQLRPRNAAGEPNLKTKTGTTLGTVAYMPPEQLKGSDIDARADVYGVGATMYRMLAGATPHRADSDVELMMKVLSEPAPRIASVVPVRADVARIVDRALAFDRDARFPDARSMQTEVRAARAETNAPMAEAIAPPPGSEVATRTPARLASASPLEPTMHAAPESALVREATPSSRLVGAASAVSAPVASPSPSPTERTRVSADVAPPFHRREIAGVPLVWLLGAGIVLLFAAGALVASLAIAALGHKEATPTATTPPTYYYAPPAQPTASDEEDREERRPPPGKGPHGHGKHKP